MKKNLQNALLLAMGLMTTVTFAQDWNVDSRTRIDMSSGTENATEDKMETSQRATLGYTFGGSDWGIHASTNINYILGTDAEGNPNEAKMSVYEAYASTDLMGYASVTVGRQALDYGSGAIISSNQWGADRKTWDGFTFGLNFDMADVTFGYASSAEVDADLDGKSQMWLNAAKGEGDWNANLLYLSTTLGDADAMTAMGLDLSYAMMGGDLNLNVSYNTASGYAAEDMDMTMLGATYNVNESMSISGSQTTYGENGFNVGSAGMQGYEASGSLGYLGANDVNMAIGGAYAMGDFNLGVTMNMITNEGDGVTEVEDRDVMDISLGYTMSANANLSLSMATDTQGDTETSYMWVTLNIMP